MKHRPTEFEQLIADYNRDNRQIADTKYRWLPPKERYMAKQLQGHKLPNRSEMATADAEADQFQGGDHKNKPSSDSLLVPDVNPKKKAAGGKPPMSPILQIMKAVTEQALNPKRKKAPKKTVKPGPSKTNHNSILRSDEDDGPSAEKSGETREMPPLKK